MARCAPLQAVNISHNTSDKSKKLHNVICLYISAEHTAYYQDHQFIVRGIKSTVYTCALAIVHNVSVMEVGQYLVAVTI